MIEILFTPEEIKEIIIESHKPEYNDPHLLHLGTNMTSVRDVAKECDLILAYGNEHTGWHHISERHNLTSRKPYWKNDKLDNPTKFPLGTTPKECIELAMQIFKFEYKNEALNKRPLDFDLYTGLCLNRKGKSHKYTLLTYRGTGVIHSFFIIENKKPYNKEKILDLRQGWSSGSHNLITGIKEITIPYYDSKDVVQYIVIIRYLKLEKRERWYIQVNSTTGEPHLTTLIRDKSLEDNIEMSGFQLHKIDFSNVTWVEKIIKKIQDNTYSF